VAASSGRPDTQTRSALETLCQSYWYPLYAFIRQKGYSAEEARDLTQEFFVRIIEGNYVQRADPRRGRFRSFLLASLKHFLYNQSDREQARKRGGGIGVIPLELVSAEESYKREPRHNLTPEKIFERSWAVTLLEIVLSELRQDFAKAGKDRQFECLRPLLTYGDAGSPYRQIAVELGLSEAALKIRVHRLRRRFRERLRARIAETVARPEEVEEEIRYLLTVLGA
jgi:RNA polymerase sigma-70 factor (ECF subfamily)